MNYCSGRGGWALQCPKMFLVEFMSDPSQVEHHGVTRGSGARDSVLTWVVPLQGPEAQASQRFQRLLGALGGLARNGVEVVLELDPSSDAGRSTYLRQSIADAGFRLIERRRGLDVAASLRSVLAEVKSGDVFLLGADVDFSGGWIDRMQAAARSGVRVGAVVPFSSDRGPFGVPAVMQVEEFTGLFSAAAANINAGASCEVPIGFGSCLLITRRCLDSLDSADFSVLDRSDGAGLCFQIVTPGLASLLACDAFALHQQKGGGHGLLEAPTPIVGIGAEGSGEYAVALNQWLLLDPIRAPRIALSLEAIRSTGLPIVLQVLHRIGGGVERHVQELVRVSSARVWNLVMRPMIGAQGVCISLGGGEWCDRLQFQLPGESKEMLLFLQAMGVCRIHVHHTLGFPPSVWGVLHELGLEFDLTLHDYSIIQGSPTLTGRQGRYIGASEPLGAYEMANVEQAELLRMLSSRASRCLVPSEDMRRRLQNALPSLSCDCRPHPDREVFGAYPSPAAPELSREEPLRILCLGALGREKGVEVLRDVARLANGKRMPFQFMLLGSAHVPLGCAVLSLGKYADVELASLIEQHRPHVVWFPVLCPETWSYTLSAALEAGLPVLASSIGAFPERLQGRPYTWLLPYSASVQDWLAKLEEVRACLRDSGGRRLPWRQEELLPFYRECYASNLPTQSSCLGALSLSFLQVHGVPLWSVAGQGGWRRKLLRLVLRARGWAPLVGLLAYVPYNVQRRIKRLISTEPLH